MNDHLKAVLKEVWPRFEEAKSDRTTIEPFIDEAFRYGLPGRTRMAQKPQRAIPESGHDIIFDNELQFNVRESAAELKTIYTPYYRHWAKFRPAEDLPKEIVRNREFQALLAGAASHTFSAIRDSQLDQALDLAWENWLISAGAVEINGSRQRGALVENIPLHELFFEPDPWLGVDGRWRRRYVRRRHIKAAYPMVDWGEYFRLKRRESGDGSDMLEIVHGYRRDWDVYPNEAWFLDIFAEGECVYSSRRTGSGSVGMIVFRSGSNSPSPWGRGPVSIALSPARALDQIAYLTMKVLPKRVDPPFVYTADGIFNAANGIKAGDAIPAGPDFQMVQLESRHGLDALYTEVEMLRRMVQRALWQDRPDPYVAGTTPPTAYQIQNQELGRSIRQERPRARINPELVVPVIERFIRIESERERMPRIDLKGKGPVRLEAQSPLSRSADLEDVQQAQMLLQLISGVLGEQGLMTVDMRTTIENIRARMGDGAALVATADPEAGLEREALSAGAQAFGSEAGALVGQAAPAALAA